MGLSDDDPCRFCHLEDRSKESAKHILCQSDRFFTLVEENQLANGYMEGSVSILLDLLKRVRLENVI